jgi:hypothetical protein
MRKQNAAFLDLTSICGNSVSINAALRARKGLPFRAARKAFALFAALAHAPHKLNAPSAHSEVELLHEK